MLRLLSLRLSTYGGGGQELPPASPNDQRHFIANIEYLVSHTTRVSVKVCSI